MKAEDAALKLITIAKQTKQDKTYEITGEDGFRSAIGLPEEDEYYENAEAELVASGSRDTLPVTHRLYRLPSGEFIHIKKTTKNKGEHYTRYYIKDVGSLEVNAVLPDRDEMEEKMDDLSIEITDDVYEVVRFHVQKTNEVLVNQPVGKVFDGKKIYFGVRDRYAGWQQVRDEIDVDFDDDEWKLFVRRTSCKNSSTHHIDTDMIVNYVAEVDFDASPFLE